MRELINYLARSLAGRPEEVAVSEVNRDNVVVLEIAAADEDINHLIGKKGRTIKAMRSLLAAVAAKNGQRFSLQIAGESPDGPQADIADKSTDQPSKGIPDND